MLTGVGGPGEITYKKSRRGTAEIDQIAQYVLRSLTRDHRVLEFSPYGYDERQFCSPGFNLPVGRLSRTPHGEYPEYHTSADDLNFVRRDFLSESFYVAAAILEILENNGVYRNTNPLCEPQLGKRGLYDEIGPDELAVLWVLNYSDGGHSLLDIAEKSGIAFQSIQKAADILKKCNLLTL